MKRLGFGAMLVAVLFGYWLMMSKPLCLTGFAPSLGPRLVWNCVAAEK
jgi:hypothetical protein